ncbi:MAG: exodeoxyribonuclease III [Pseudomonadota bacterium]|jgi:exodeoxyribonuclease III|nr:exodeoxyribonuclease III [Alphaproteobacteria bacterium]
MKIVTWNVNSLNARLPVVLQYLRQSRPDVALLQETKCVDEKFPAGEIEDLGYNLALNGQKTYNGVAILSKRPIEDVRRGLPGDEADDQARYIEALIPTSAAPVRVASVYAPNGNPPDSPKLAYKLNWLHRLRRHAGNLLKQEESLVLGGDLNVILTDDDVHDPAAWEGDALFLPQSINGLRAILNLGLTDAYRACHSEPHRYTFWDYQRGAWAKDHGIRIDYLLLSPQAADRLKACEIDKQVRGWEKPSDHVPVWLEIEE